MANYKLITFTPTASATSQKAFTAGATNTVVSSVVASDSSTSTLEVLVKKNAGSIIELAHSQVQTDKPEELLTAPVALEALDELYVRTSRVGANFVISYVEESTTPNDTALGGLLDVDTTGVADGESLVYNATNSQWEPAVVSGGGGGSSTLSGLSDTTLSGNTAGDLLRYNGGVWVNAAGTTDIITEGATNLYYTDARVDARIAADTTKADASHTHTHNDITDFDTEVNALITAANLAAASHTHTLADITDSGTAAALDVPATGDAAAGEVVKGDDTRLTDARTPTSHTHVAADITDFDTEVSNNTTVTGNTSLATAALGAANTATQDLNTHQSSIENHSDVSFSYTDLNRPNNAFIVWDDVNGRWEDGTISIDKCDDVDTTTTAPTTGDVLEWDGSNFVPAAPSATGGTNIHDTDTTFTNAGDYDAGADLMDFTTTALTLAAGKPYALSSTGWAVASNANSSSTSLIAVCTSDSSTGSAMLLRGLVRTSDALSGNIGDPVYLGTGSKWTMTAPTSGASVVVLGRLIDATNNVVWFDPDKTVITLQ